MSSEHADVIVIGAGLAGIVCALELLERGPRRVLLLDRDLPARVGGLARESFGGLLLVDTPLQRRHGLRDSPELAWQDWLAFGGFEPASAEPGHPDHWPRRWAEHYVHDALPRLYHWLRDQGIRFLPLPLWAERGVGPGEPGAARGNSVPRWHVVWGTGEHLIRTLLERLNRHPHRDRLTLRFGHKVEALVSTHGAVIGCRGVREGEGGGVPFEADASQVVIAAGGINGGDLSLARQHWHPDWGTAPATLLNGSHRFADGTLHRAAEAVGGQLTHLNRQWNYAAGIAHWHPRQPHHGLSLVPPKSALWLNARGERVWPPLVSGFDTRELVTQVCAQPGGYSWLLMNRRIALKELAISGAEFNPNLRQRRVLGVARDLLLGQPWLLDQLLTHSRDVAVGRDLDELASKMNAVQGDAEVRAESLREAVARYDQEVALGAASTDPQRLRIAQLRQWKGDRTRTCAAARILDTAAQPLIALRTHIISRKSLGGLLTDLDSRVLGADGRPLSGLYAIGEAAGFGGGGMHGLRGLEGSFLGGCICSAQRAARAMS
jgi:predicted oxidoreductase